MTNISDNLDIAAEITQAATDNILANHAQMMRKAESLKPLAECRQCGERISEARQRAVKGVQCCVACQETADQRAKGYRR